MPPANYTKIRAAAFTPPSGDGTGYEDAGAALTPFKIALHALMTKIKALKDGDDVLTVVLGPEWLFRKPQGTHKVDGKDKPIQRFMDYGEMGLIVDGLIKLSKNYPDTLIAPGSILWAIPGKKEVEAPKSKWPWAKQETMVIETPIVYNTCPIVANGKLVHVYHKQFWGLDTKSADGQVFAFEPKGALESLQDFKTKCKSVGADGKPVKAVICNLFKYENLEFGIEICADHSVDGKGVITKECAGKTVDIHLLVSCGMFILGPSIAARPGGFIIHTDGGNTTGPNLQKTGLGWVKCTAKGKFEPDPKKQNLIYKADGKTFIGSHPNMACYLDDLLELTPET